MDEPRLSIAKCRALLGTGFRDSLGNEEIERMRDMLYSLADVITDAFLDLGSMDQSAFYPPGDALTFFEERDAELRERAKHKTVSE